MSQLRVGLAQIAPHWLEREKTLKKVAEYIKQAADQQCQLIVFGEALVPGYPFWIELTDGARFGSTVQQDMHTHYLQQAVQIEAGHLDHICALAARYSLSIYLGIIERPQDRGGHSVYASLVYIDDQGNIVSVHRKLMPTYEERLSWAAGDGHGLVVHQKGSFCLGGLNCWENWMPLPRAALYAQGENVHVAVWPGNVHNTQDITRFIAKESRSYVISVSGLLSRDDAMADFPQRDLFMREAPAVLANGGSCVAAPDGEWLLPPQADKEALFCVDLHWSAILAARHNFDPVGHYSRADVTKLNVNRTRQSTLQLTDLE